MRISIAHTLRKYDRRHLPKDLFAGILIAAVSIPISMGYAQIAGLPAVTGLYGSVFPILLFALLSTSPQFVFGVDAAPAALVGSVLLSLGIESGSAEAAAVVPVITFWVAVWLLAFFFLKAGKLVSYISVPVMGGFITGICTEIILMQVPKLMGGGPGTGELPELLRHIWETFGQIHVPSVILGVLALAVLLTAKKLCPKFPTPVLLMALGAALTRFCPSLTAGIPTLDAVEPGLPAWRFPELAAADTAQILTASLSIAVVIMAETLLAENSFAMKNGYRIRNNQEILAFSAGNFAAALTGCCPINGSVSRTAMSEQVSGKTQLAGLTAGVVMIAVLLFCTGFIGYLPVPVLTAIVISALMGATEFELAGRLWKINRKECLIFFGAFLGVLLLGTVNGVLIGILLSFAEMIIRSAKPARCFLGIQPGHAHFRELGQNRQVFPIEGVVIYRFSSALFFANVDVFQSEIEDAVRPDTRAVIVDASGIGSLDITAADRLAILYRNLKERGIHFFLTEHIAGLNDQLRSLGLGYMIEEGAVRRTVHVALKSIGISRPYPLAGEVENESRSAARKRIDNRIQEFTWAYGADTEAFLEHQIRVQIEHLKISRDLEELLHSDWGYMEAMDEDEWLTRLEEHLQEIVQATGKDSHAILDLFEHSREETYERLKNEDPGMLELYRRKHRELDAELKQKYPEVYERIRKIRDRKE